MTRDNRAARAGFTLIELLIVMAIIAVMVALLLPAAFKILGRGPEVAAKNDMNGFNQGIAAFKSEFHVTTMPSRLILFEQMAMYDPATNSAVTPEEKESRAFLSKMFGRRLNPNIDWNGDGTIQNGTAGRYALTGEQCLVWFLGGPNGLDGFSGEPTNPMASGGSRRGPFYNFAVNRLVAGSKFNSKASDFLVYIDAFQVRGKPADNMTEGPKPYVYFGSRGTNDYMGDNLFGLTPYRETAGRFMNPDSFQVISAGANGVFGTPVQFDAKGNVSQLLWTPKDGYNGNSKAGDDDFANFSAYRLGSGQS